MSIRANAEALRTLGDVEGHEFHGNQYGAHQAAHERGFYHGQTGYGFQKSVAGRKGSAQHKAYTEGYHKGVDASGDLHHGTK